MSKDIYTCHMCGKTFERGNVSCAVLHQAGDCCHYGDKEITQTKPSEENKEWEKYFKIWKEQGRSEEQQYGVTNFMTGQGKLMLKDIKFSLLDSLEKEIKRLNTDEPLALKPLQPLTSIESMGGHRAYNQALDDVLAIIEELRNEDK